VESQRLTAWAIAQSFQMVTIMLWGKADKMLVYISIPSSTLPVTWYKICCHKKFRQWKDMTNCNVDRVGRQHETTTIRDTELKNYAEGVDAYGMDD
jgi:hypothetical protein